MSENPSSPSRARRAAQTVGIAVAASVVAATVGSAAATPSASGAARVAAPVPAGAVTETLPIGTAVGSQPTSWRETATTSRAPQRPSRAAARAAVVAQQARFATFTLRSKATRDMRGVEKSLYRGKYFNAAAERKRLCVVERESEGRYDVVNPGGSYFGAYQVSRALARGATWMMLKEHRKLMGDKTAKRVLADLRAKPMNRWPRYWQDAAFHTIINWDGTLSGASHWAGGRWHC